MVADSPMSGCLTWLLLLLFAPFLWLVGSQSTPPEVYELFKPGAQTARPSATPETVADYPLGIWLAPADESEPEQLEEAADIITVRLENAEFDSAVAIEEGQIHIQTWGTSEEVVPLVTQIGLLEFVGMDDVEILPLEGTCMQTSEIEARFGENSPCPSLEVGQEPLTTLDGEPFVTIFTGEFIEEASVGTDAFGGSTWVVNFTLTEQGGSDFAEYTENHIDEPLAIILDGEVMSVPVITARIEGVGLLQGNFVEDEAERLANILNTDPLPLRLEMVGIKTYWTEE
jgi:preprotein translocase subunit SecD